MSTLIGFEASEAAYRMILDESRAAFAALGSTATASQFAVSVDKFATRLLQFTREAEPKDFGDTAEVSRINGLVLQADESRRKMRVTAIGQALHEIEDRIAELNKFVKLVRQEAVALKSGEKAIRLAVVKQAIDALKGVADLIQSAEEAVDTGNPVEKRLASLFQKILKAIGDLKKSHPGAEDTPAPE